MNTVNKSLEREYWNGYYKAGTCPSNPSAFALFCAEHIKSGERLVDVGCGNGRDSMFFRNSGVEVTSLDTSETAIDAINALDIGIKTICGSFSGLDSMYHDVFDFCYVRWVFHAITPDEQDSFIENAWNCLNDGGKLVIEVRTVNDPKFMQGECVGVNQYIYDGHYRNFIVPDVFCEKLEKAGFSIDYRSESNQFSEVGEDRPALLRIIAVKSSS